MNLSFGLEVIYEDMDFHIDTHNKTSVMGVNDVGKTTLLHALMYGQELDSGTVSTDHLRVGYPPQEIIFENESCTMFEYLQSERPTQKLENELNQVYRRSGSADSSEHTQLFRQMEKLQSRLESLDYYEADSVLLHIIDRMQINIDLPGMPLGSLSGRQKSQIAFAHVLYTESDILFLDEPTNHLDTVTKEFITGFLRNYKGTVLIISHDISLPNQIINKILFINKATHKIPVYNGSHDTYGQKYAQEQRLREQAIVQEGKEVPGLEEFVCRINRASRTNHALKRMGQERILRLEKE